MKKIFDKLINYSNFGRIISWKINKFSPMNTWNTITNKRTNALDQAVFTLETLSHPDNVPIIEYLTRHGEVTLLDITVHTGFDMNELETQLDALVQTGVVRTCSSIYSNKYCISFEQITKINHIVRLLVNEK